MDLATVLKVIAGAKEIADAIPGLVAALKGTLSADDEAKLKAALAERQAANTAKFAEAQALLSGIAGA